jgi:O-antigen/teichoic acid export membrane protein
MMLGIVIAPFGSLLLAKSLTGDYVRFMLLGLAVKVAVLIAMAPFGLVVVAIAYSLSGTVIVLTALTVLKRRLGIGFRAHMRAVASSVLIAAIVAGCVFATWSLILKAGWTNLTNLALIAPFSVACWVGASWRLHAPLRQEIDLLRRRALRMRWGV